MIDLFVGWDHREAVGYSVFCHSVISQSTKPVRITPLAAMGMPEGSNSFTLSRFLVPYFMNFKGHAIFADGSDMLLKGDLTELDLLYDSSKAVQVVKHPEYLSLHERKYVGTEMECGQTNYPRKNWASLMIFNAAHPVWHGLTPEKLKICTPIELLRFETLDNSEIGELPKEWNVLVDEGQDMNRARCLHWTAGIPAFPHYQNARGSKDWFKAFDQMTQGRCDG